MGLHDSLIQDIANNVCAETGMYSVYGNHDTSSMQQLINAFKTNNSLTTFIFSSEEVDDLKQLSKLFETLNKHEPLQELKLVTEFELNEDNLEKLEQLIKTHPTLRSVTLSNYVCNATQLKHLTNTLENCEQLKEFVCIINDIPDDVLLDMTNKLVRYNHLQSIIVNPENVTKKQMEDLVNTMQSNTHPNLRHLGLAASTYEPEALPALFDYLETNNILTELGLGDITNIDDFKQLADIISKNNTLISLSCEITPTEEFFNTADKLISNNNTLKVYQYFTEYSKLNSSPELTKLANTIEEKISDKIAKNEAQLNMSNPYTIPEGTRFSKKRSNEAAAYDPLLSKEPPQKRPCYSLDKKDENTHENTNEPQKKLPSITSVKS